MSGIKAEARLDIFALNSIDSVFEKNCCTGGEGHFGSNFSSSEALASLFPALVLHCTVH